MKTSIATVLISGDLPEKLAMRSFCICAAVGGFGPASTICIHITIY
ncbi:hypothetical protein FHS26_002220 [Rhizobium pisi]|uniref:Uncharacterized protein n=1 Tax=Rhizobium pisi TaxID=574561 RepID=A0A7W5BK84_9HYPH|nr:hypothetical protein [Rhizobium pisi]MBB3134490.1 hypothetical protein [Rhizobium pisi]